MCDHQTGQALILRIVQLYDGQAAFFREYFFKHIMEYGSITGTDLPGLPSDLPGLDDLNDLLP